MSLTRIARLAAASPQALAGEQTFCINPWRERRHHDATVKLSNIRRAQLVGFDHGGDGWLAVLTHKEHHTHDGKRVLTTELASNDPTVLDLSNRLRAAGVSVETFRFGAPRRSGEDWSV